MNTRLDSLFALLGKDSSQAARKAAAQQIGEVQKSHPYDLQNLLERAHFYLHSPHWDTRIAASQAIEAIVSHVPQWQSDSKSTDVKIEVKSELDENGDAKMKVDQKADVSTLGRLKFDLFDVKLVMENGKVLLASEGLEFERVAALSPEELAKQRQQILRELQLKPGEDDFLEDEDLKADGGAGAQEEEAKDETKSAEIQSTLTSSRMRNVAKRKQKQDTHSRPTLMSGQMTGDRKTKTLLTDQPQTDDKLVMESVLDVDRAFEDVNEWPLERFCDALCVELFDKSWVVRHGAALGLREILKVHSSGAGKRADSSPANQLEENRVWIEDCTIRLVCVIMLDRFADFSSDQPIAHVREACAQVLGTLMTKMVDTDLKRLLDVLEILINESDHWEVRHGAFLALKYLVAIRPAFSEENIEKIIAIIFEGLDDLETDVKAVAADAAHPLILKNISPPPSTSSTSLPKQESAAEQSRVVSTETCTQLLSVLSTLLTQLDDVSSATNNIMVLLASLCTLIGQHPGLVTTLDAGTLIPTLFPFFRHAVRSVRLSVLKTVESLLLSESSTSHLWLFSVAPTLLQLLFQNFLLEEDAQIVSITHNTWRTLLTQTSQLSVNVPVQVQLEDGTIAEQDNLSTLTSAIVTTEVLLSWFKILSSPLGRPIDSSQLLKVPFHSTGSDDHGDLADFSSSHVSDRKVVTSECYENLCSAMASFASIAQEYTNVFVQFVTAMVTGLTGSERIAGALFVSKWIDAFAELCFRDAASETKEKEDPFVMGFPEALWTLMNDCASKWESQFYFTETEALMTSMRIDCKKLIKAFNENGVSFDLGVKPEEMTVDQGKALFGETFDKLIPHVRDVPKNGSLPSQELKGLRVRAISAMEHLDYTQHTLHITSSAMLASAVVSMSHASIANSSGSPHTPPSLNYILKPLLQALTLQTDPIWQQHSAASIASLTHAITAQKSRDLTVSRIVGALYVDPTSIEALTFAQDIEASVLATAAAASSSNSKKRKAPATSKNNEELVSDEDEEGIMALDLKKPKLEELPVPTPSAPEPSPTTPDKSIGKKGSELTLVAMAKTHGASLFSDLPSLWQSIYSPLVTAAEDEASLSKSCIILITIAPAVHSQLKEQMLSLIPLLVKRASSTSSITVRALSAQAIASIVRFTTPQSMNVLVTHVLPALQDAENVSGRRGASLALHACIATLELEVLPYLIFMIVPVLGRMSDQDDIVRKTMSFSFATLVKLMPLEARVPNPPDMPQQLIDQRTKERVFLEQLLGGRKVDAYDMPIKINTELRAYQQDGVNWLAFLNKYNLHGILADDMGLGKTLQTICIVNSDYVYRAQQFAKTGGAEFKPLPTLVVCPPILVPHWESEVRRFCDPSIRVAQYKGSAQERTAVRNNAYQYQLIVTSYDVLRNDIDSMSSIQFNYCVLDEGHIIRNTKTKVTQSVKRVRANHRLILSGTPIQNNVLELWSLFDFLMPGFLGSERQFMTAYSKPVMASRDSNASAKDQERGTMALEALHRQVLPFILRRMKEDVLHDLPPKIIQDVNVELSPLQLKLYTDFAKNNSPGDDDTSQHVFQSLQYLRKLVSHPKLVVTPNHPKYSDITQSLYQEGRTLDDYTLSPKLVALKELLLSCGIGQEKTGVDAGITQNRVLIFSQLKTMLDIVEKDLFKKDMPLVSYLRLDGDVPTGSRMPIVERFNSNPSIDVLLLTVSVGGLGLNLTGANTVIFLEHDWNPQNDLQAMDRVHRIGQKKTVNVYRLITKGTLEEKIMGLQKFKLHIANSVVNKENQSFQSMDTSMLLDLFNVSEADKKSATSATEGVDELGNVVAGKQTKGLKGLLDSLEELGDQSRYAEEYSLDTLLSQIQ